MWHLTTYFIEQFKLENYSLLTYVLASVVVAVILLVFVSMFAGLTSYIERRIAGRIMSRVGPNRVGPQGLFQFVADGIKNFTKEDIIPDEADSFLFKIAPYLVFSGMFGTFVALPFGFGLIASDLDVGIYYVIAITALVVVGIILGGWSSNSKWSVFGGLRSAAQIVSYEIPVALSIMVVILLSGTLSTQGIIRAQGGWPWEWFIFNSPFAFLAFFTYFIAALAEGNRTPFDLPEAESELVAGYCTEYSGFRFLVFFFAEWANLWIMSAIAVVCFLGGWNVPFFSDVASFSSWTHILLSLVVFSVKTLLLVTVIIQLRWTLPRLRLDQMMNLCWKYLVPISLFAIFGTMTWMLIDNASAVLGWIVRIVMLTFGLILFAYYVHRIVVNYNVDKENYKKMTGKSLWYPPYRLP